MALTTKMRNACITGHDDIKAAFDGYMKANKAATDDGGLFMRRKADETKAAYEKALEASRGNIDKIYADLIEAIRNHFTVKGESMTQDANLFNTDVPVMLTLDELSAFCEKYKDNWTMTRIIRGYADKFYPGYELPHYSSAEPLLVYADRIHSYCIQGLQDSIIFDNVIASQSGWDKICHYDELGQF